MKTTLLPLLGLMLASLQTHAVTVYFDDADRGPASSLQIGDLTVSVVTGPPSAKVATVSGHGLGLDGGMGQIYEFNELITQINGNYLEYGYNDFEEAGFVGFTVPGTIDSITLLPFARVYSPAGALLPDQPWFDIYCPMSFVNAYPHVYPGNVTTLHWTGPQPISTLTVGVDHDFPPEFWLSLDIGNTAELGFSILSLDYTPIPEPGALCLFAVGLLSFYRARRR
jgi:hypothetical protein